MEHHRAVCWASSSTHLPLFFHLHLHIHTVLANYNITGTHHRETERRQEETSGLIWEPSPGDQTKTVPPPGPRCGLRGAERRFLHAVMKAAPCFCGLERPHLETVSADTSESHQLSSFNHCPVIRRLNSTRNWLRTFATTFIPLITILNWIISFICVYFLCCKGWLMIDYIMTIKLIPFLNLIMVQIFIFLSFPETKKENQKWPHKSTL